MAFYNAAKYDIQEYTNETTWVKVLNEDSQRRSIIFYVIPGDPTPSNIGISFESTAQDNNHIDIQDGVMWEPKLTPTNEVWVKVPTAATTNPILSIMVAGTEAFIV